MRAVARWLAPALDVLRSGREPTSPERRRLVLVGGAVAAAPRAGSSPGRWPALALGAAAPWLARAALRARRSPAASTPSRPQVPAIARALADALAGGHSVRGALAAAARGGGVRGPAGEELRAADAALELGERTDDVLRELARRAGPGPLRHARRRRAAAARRGRRSRGPAARRSPRRSSRAAASSPRRARRPRRRASPRLLVTGLPLAGLVARRARAAGPARGARRRPA